MRSFRALLCFPAIASLSQVTNAFLPTSRPGPVSTSSTNSDNANTVVHVPLDHGMQSLSLSLHVPSLVSTPITSSITSSIPRRPCTNHRLFMSSKSSPVGKAAGLSITAIRASIRATTGLSLTAMRTTLRTLTGVSISGIFKSILAIFPPQFRYFIQPFLVVYYVPLFILRGMIGTTKTSKADDRKNHEKLVEHYREAVKAAEDKIDGWPLHVQADGSFVQENMNGATTSKSMTDAIVESVEIANETKKEK